MPKLPLFLLSLFFILAAGASAITADKQNSPSPFITYNSKNEPKARGLNFNIEYPADWDSKEGKRPHIARLFAQAKFDGTILKVATVAVYVNKLSDDEMPDLNDEGFFSAENARSLLPDNAVFLAFQKTKLEGCDAMLIEYRQQAERAGEKFFMRGLMCAFFYKNYYINIQTLTTAFSQSSSEEYFKEYKPTFMRMINSFVLLDKWHNL